MIYERVVFDEKLLQHAKRVLGEVEARLRELESELRTFGVLMPDGGESDLVVFISNDGRVELRKGQDVLKLDLTEAITVWSSLNELMARLVLTRIRPEVSKMAAQNSRPRLMPDGGGPECYRCSTQTPLELLRAHGLAGYLVIYDLPVGTPRWKLRRELTKLAEAGIAWHYIQKSVIWCPTEGDAGAVAQAILSIADGPSKVEVFAVAKMSWHDLIKAAEERKRWLLARKLRRELNMAVSPEDLASLSIADIERLLRLKGEKLAKALEVLGLSPGATPVAPEAPMRPLEAWARMDEEAAHLQSATGVAARTPVSPLETWARIDKEVRK